MNFSNLGSLWSEKINLKLDKITRIKFHWFLLVFGSVIVCLMRQSCVFQRNVERNKRLIMILDIQINGNLSPICIFRNNLHTDKCS